MRWAGGLLQQQLQEFSVIVDSLPAQAWQRARVRNGCLIADNDNFPDPMDPLLALRGCGAFFAWPSRAGLKSHTLVVRPTPTGTLVLKCSLRAYRDTLQASFMTISGTSCVPTITLERRQVTLRCLTSKVHKLVVKGNQLVSRQQKVRLIFPGMPNIPASGAIVWSRSIRRRAPQLRLRRKTDISNANLQNAIKEACDAAQV